MCVCVCVCVRVLVCVNEYLREAAASGRDATLPDRGRTRIAGTKRPQAAFPSAFPRSAGEEEKGGRPGHSPKPQAKGERVAKNKRINPVRASAHDMAASVCMFVYSF